MRKGLLVINAVHRKSEIKVRQQYPSSNSRRELAINKLHRDGFRVALHGNLGYAVAS